MSEILGKIEKPEVNQFKNGRKLFFVPLFFKPMEKDANLSEMISLYWSEVENHLANLESKLSKIKRVYHELLLPEESVKRLKELSTGSHRIVESLMVKGAVLTEIEDIDRLDEFFDWWRCLSLELQSPTVFSKVIEAYQEAQHRRDEHAAKRIDETLQPDETAALFITEGCHVQFATDIQVFYVAPPSLDAIHRALRERQELSHHENERDKSQDKPKTNQSYS